MFSYFNIFNSWIYFLDLPVTVISDSALIGIVMGTLVTMFALISTVGVVIYTCLLRRHNIYSKRIRDGNELPSNYKPSSYHEMPSHSTQIVIPCRWVSMWDAFQMPGYNPTFQRSSKTVKREQDVPKWIQMLDDLEKSGCLQTFWQDTNFHQT